jgi:RimJ/RimL family protein N-acetyltransferase
MGGVSIRGWRLDDAFAVADVINNKAVLDNLRDGVPFPYTEKDGAEFIGSMIRADADSVFAFAITLDGRVVGSIGAFRQGNVHGRTAEIGYYIAEEHWGKGVTTEAVRLLCRHIFENTDIIRIFAEPFAHNAASCRVLEKAGFSYEGTLRANAVKNGKILDMKMYARIKE